MASNKNTFGSVTCAKSNLGSLNLHIYHKHPQFLSPRSCSVIASFGEYEHGFSSNLGFWRSFFNKGYWKESEAMRKIVKTKGLQKVAGRSWIELDKQVHVFFGGDDTHPQIENNHNVLKEMERRMKQELDYVYGVKHALHDVEDESKIESLRAHSEKLAIGLALAQGGLEEEGRVIRIFKNLRACGDCHEFIKFVEDLENGFCCCERC